MITYFPGGNTENYKLSDLVMVEADNISKSFIKKLIIKKLGLSTENKEWNDHVESIELKPILMI
jgi:hypothetical protein